MFHWIDARDRLVCLETGAVIYKTANGEVVYEKPGSPDWELRVVTLEKRQTEEDALSALKKIGDYLQAYKL